MKKVNDVFIVLLLSFFMVEAEPISLNHIVCHPDGASPQLHGFPFISHTDIPWVNSGEYSIYVKGYLLNLLFWNTLIYFILKTILLRIKISSIVRLNIKRTLMSILLPSLSILLFYKLTVSAQFQWTHPFDQRDCPVEMVFFPKH